jgi:polyisoprenoid-binding protein YceI
MYARRYTTARSVVLATLLCAATAPGEYGALGGRSGSLELEPERSAVRFTLPGRLHDTHGTFRVRTGTMALDAATGDASGLIVVDATSGDTGNPRRDRRMKDDVLETARFPEIRFHPRHVDGHLGADGDFEGTIHGVLMLHGADHPIAAVARGRVSGSDVHASCRFSIPYVAWGLQDPSVLLLTVAPEVGIDVEAVGHVRWVDGLAADGKEPSL